MNASRLQTPAFLVDIDRVQDNCDRMRVKAERSSVVFRPHVKTHKTVEIAKMQHGGAIGPITVSTLAEAEFFAKAGFGDITYGVPIAPDKLPRVESLMNKGTKLNVVVDSETALASIRYFASSGGPQFDAFLKVDCGYHRAGVDPKSPDSVRLAVSIAKTEGVRFRGLLTHAGHSYVATDVDDVIRIASEEAGAVALFARRLEGEVIRDLVRSVGSTPTLSVIERFTGCDEVRPGNYVFFDVHQEALGSCRRENVAVSVLTTVVGSYPDRKQAIIDAGALALSKDGGPVHLDKNCGFGTVCDLDLNPLPMRLTSLSQEHGKLECKVPPPVGTKLRIVPNHSCLTAALFDRYAVIRDGAVVDEWKPVRGW